MAADPNVLGLNIELQLSSDKFQTELNQFVDTGVVEAAAKMSTVFNEAIARISFSQAKIALELLATSASPIRDALDVSGNVAQMNELTNKAVEASQVDVFDDQIESTTDLRDGFRGITDQVQKYSDITNGLDTGAIASAVDIIGKEEKGLIAVQKAIKKKNLGHEDQNTLVKESNNRITDMKDRVSNVTKSLSKTNKEAGYGAELFKKMYDGILRAAEGAEDFVTANFRAYGHQEQIMSNTDTMIAQYGLLAKSAFKATRALMEEGLKPEKIEEATVMVSKLERVTGVGAEQLAAFTRQGEIMGLSVSDTAGVLLQYEDAQKKYNLSASEAATLMKKMEAPAKTLQRFFLTNAKAVREFASTKAQMAGFAKSVGANIGEVVGLMDKLAEGSVQTMTSLMAFSGISKLTAGNMDQAFALSGKRFKEMLKGAGDDALAKAAIMDSLRQSTGLTTGQIETMIKSYESEEEAIKEIARANGGNLVVGERIYRQKQALLKQQQEMKAKDPTAYLANLNVEWGKSTDNLTAKYNQFKDAIEAVGDVLYSFFFPALQFLFDLLLKATNIIGIAIDWIRKTYNEFIAWAGISESTEYWIRVVLGSVVLLTIAIGLFGSTLGWVGALISVIGGIITWVGGLIMGTAVSTTTWSTLVTPALTAVGGALTAFFAALTPVRKTMVMVSASMFLMATSVMILVFAIKKLSEIGWAEFAKGLTMAALTMVVLAGALFLVSLSAGASAPGLLAASVAIVALGVSVILLAIAFNMLAGIKLEVLIGIAVALVILVAALTVFGLWVASIGWIAVAGLLAIGAAALMVGTGLYLAAASVGVLGAGFAYLASQLTTMAEGAKHLAMFGAAMFLFTAMVLPFTLSLVILGVALNEFAVALWWCGTRIEDFAAQLLLFGEGLTKINEALQGIYAVNAMSGALDATANSMLRLSSAIGVFPTAKAAGMSEVLKAMAASTAAASNLTSVGAAINDINYASKSTTQLDAYNATLEATLAKAAGNQKGVDNMVKLGTAFAAIGKAAQSMSNLGTILMDFHNGLERFADIGKIPENLGKVGAAMRKVPGLSQKLAEPVSLDMSLEEINKNKDELTKSIEAFLPLGPKLTEGITGINKAAEGFTPLAEALKKANKELTSPVYYFWYVARDFAQAAEKLSKGAMDVKSALSNQDDLKAEGEKFVEAIRSIVVGFDSIYFTDFKQKMGIFSDGTAYLAKATTKFQTATTAINNFANALQNLANSIAAVASVGAVKFDAEGMVSAATKATQSVEKYKQAVDGTQKSLQEQKKTDSQPISQVQVRTGEAGVAGTGSFEEKQYNELRTLNAQIKTLLERMAAGGAVAASGSSGDASTSADSNSFTSNGWV